MSVRVSAPLLVAVLLLLPRAGSAQPAHLPVTTLRYEAAQGAEEDEEDAAVEPEYLRHTLSARVREELSPALTVALLLRYSQKDFFQSGTDYAYWQIAPELVLRRRDAWRLEASLSCRVMDNAPLGGGWDSPDRLDLGTRLGFDLDLTPRITLSSSLRGAVEVAADAAESRQLYTLGVGLESRLGGAGQVLLGLRYAGTGRFPAGLQSLEPHSSHHLGAFSLVWDPNRR